MNKLYTILVLTALALSSASAQFTHTNSATVDAYEVTGNFDSYSWEWIGADSQSNTFYITFNGTPADLSSATLGWKMSLNTSTGKLDYLIVPDSDITYSATGTVTFAVANTNIPPDNTYLTELFAYTGATNVTRTLAQGIVDVRQSLYESDSEYTFPTSVDPADYVIKAGDFTQFTGLGGTAGQFWGANGSGGGSWATISASVAWGAITGTLSDQTDLQNALDAKGVGDFLADGSVPMTGDLNMGGNDLTNASGVAIADGVVSTGVPLSISDAYNGALRSTTINTSDGIYAQSAVQVKNNLGYRASLSVFGGSHGSLANVAGLYSTGYGDLAYVLDGNHDHVWYTDKDDGHSFGALTNEIMKLTSGGNLTVAGTVEGIDIATDVPLNTTHRTSDGSDHSLVVSALQNGDNVSELVNDAGYGVGDVTKVGTPANNRVGVWTGDGTLEGTSNFTWDDSSSQFKGIMNGGLQVNVTGDIGSDFQAKTDTTEGLYVDASANRVGVGTATPSATLDVVGNIAVSGTVDGADIASDSSKLSGIEALADVTDTANVTSAGALMDSELTDIASVKALDQGVATTDSPSFAAVTMTGTTNVLMDTFTLNGTNYVSFVLSGSSVTNLMALEY